LQIQRQENGAFVVSEIEPPLHEILLAIPTAADPAENVAANERLFPDPVTHEDADEICEEWRDYVKPELYDWFQSATSIVAADLNQLLLKQTLEIASTHVDAWLTTLNQARLVLAARFDITEEDMDRPVSHLLENERDFALFQIHLYAFLQECLIRGIE